VTQNGTTGWAIAIAAGIVLVATTALRIRQVAKDRAKTPTGGTPGPPVGGSTPQDQHPALSNVPAERLDV
jgi:hypothetical protein